ncbi:MAG: hypothetical protein H0V34_06415 [Gammaproteobacteria bacterium]|nr:hypothetical protein [Gammaproteobacteria bacterium]
MAPALPYLPPDIRVDQRDELFELHDVIIAQKPRLRLMHNPRRGRDGHGNSAREYYRMLGNIFAYARRCGGAPVRSFRPTSSFLDALLRMRFTIWRMRPVRPHAALKRLTTAGVTEARAEALIRAIDDISHQGVTDFVRQLIFISSQTSEQSQEIRERTTAAMRESNDDRCSDFFALSFRLLRAARSEVA